MKWIIFVIVLLLLALFFPFRFSIAEAPTKLPVKEYAFTQVLKTWDRTQWESFKEIIYRESKWNSEAKNPRSSAFGLGQFLNSTWKTVGCVKTSDPYIQVDCAIKYIKLNYGVPKKALLHHNKLNWY